MEITKVQERLARSAYYQPNKRTENLYSLIRQPELLETAFDGISRNEGANTAGVDGVIAKDIDVKRLVREISDELWNGSYTPSPVRRVYIPKANGKLRPLGIPTIKDRVVQEAIRMILEPVMESHFLECSVGFRPSRRTMDAIHLMTLMGSNQVKMFWVVEGDIEGCFDNIPHKKLIGVLKQYIDDKHLIELIKKFLNAGIAEKGKVSKPNTGVPQGGVVSPLLTNIYLHEMDKHWWEKYGKLTEGQKNYRRVKGLGNVQYVRYADDFVIMTNGDKQFAYELREEFREVLAELGLNMSDEKTHVTHLNDGLDFLGFNLKRVHSKDSNKSIVLVTPTQRNIEKFKERITEMTSRKTVGDDPINKIRAINQVVSGWGNYYRHVNVADIFSELSSFVHMRIFYWLKAKHSNVSAKRSVKAYVTQTYLTKRTIRGKKVTTWGYGGSYYKPMWIAVKRGYYRINKPKNGNPYLEDGAFNLTQKDEIPLSDTYWRGNSSQSAYSIARMDKLREVGYKCEECGSSDELDAHHIVPKSKGGKHTVSNLKILCKVCHVSQHSESNKRKRSK